MTILAFDASLSCTGWAVLHTHHNPWRVHDAGTIKLRAAESDDPTDRLFELFADVIHLVLSVIDPRPDLIVIERPETKSVGGSRQNFGKRGFADMAHYGAAYAAVALGVREAMQKGTQLLRPTPSEWVGRGCIPSSRGDPHKEKRVAWVEQLHPEWAGKLGPKTYAGNVADAILMARWGAQISPVLRASKGA